MPNYLHDQTYMALVLSDNNADLLFLAWNFTLAIVEN